MAYRSVARRVHRAILAVSIVTILVMVATVLFVNEDLEHTMLQVELAQERDYILTNHVNKDLLVRDTPNLAIAFIPTGEPRPEELPPVFRELSGEDDSAEIKVGSETYLVSVKRVENGVLYIAKNITHFEDREALFNSALLIMTLFILAFSLLLATLSSRRVVLPLTQLSESISRIPVGRSMPRLQNQYPEAELHAIATSFNRFLDELESYVRREQSLLGLAGHELRTPIAVISGALDVIETRGRLNANDQATLERMRRSCDEMRDNVNILLKLSRREPSSHAHEAIQLKPALQRIMEDLNASHAAKNRVKLEVRHELSVVADPAMVHMLLRNLLQNAIQHTRNDIQIRLSDDAIEIEDEGTGLDSGQQAILRGEHTLARDGTSPSGLGLYIVTLMAERLGWKLEIARTDRNGTVIRIIPRPGAILFSAPAHPHT